MSALPPNNSLYLITHEFYPKRGGIATFAEEMAKASVSLGLDVEVWAQAAGPQAEKEFPFRLRRLPIRGTHDLECQLRLALQLIRDRRKLRYATVYLPEPGPMLALMLLQGFHAFRPKRLILTFHGSEILRFSRHPFIRPLARRLIRKASRISVLSHYSQELLLTHFPEAAGKVLLTPGALRSDFAVVNHQPESRPRHQKTVILTVGRLHPRKGQLLTLEALRALAPRFRHRIEYWVVGSPTKPAYARALRESAATADFPVRFFGDLPDDELDRLYDGADIFAMTSIEYGDSVEGFGLVYLEAAAHALPVVAHAVGGVGDAVIDGQTGLLVPPDHPAQLTAAFEKLISDRGLRHRLGSAGRLWAQQNSWTQSARLLFEALPAA
jgi:phosphatidyl-myo-inositol dimannoside synthase